MNSSAVSTPHERPTRRRYLVMVFLCVLAFLTYFDRVCIERAQPDIRRDLKLSKEDMGLVFGAFWLAYALFELPGGWMGDRYGARVILTRIVLAWSLFTALTGCATGLVSLLAYRLLFGAGEAGAFPNMARVQGSWLPVRSRGRAGGLLWLLARWGGAFAPLLFGGLLQCFDAAAFRGFLASVGLADDIAAWRLAFGAVGLVGVLWCLAFYRWFRDNPAAVPSVNAAELRLIKSGDSPRPSTHHMPRRIWWNLLCSPSLWALSLLYVCSSFGWSFFVSWLPQFLDEVHHIKFEKSELMSGLPLFCGGISCLAGGVLSDLVVRRTRRKWLGRALFPICGYTTAAAAMLCVPYAQTADQANFLMCLANVGTDFGQGANWATIVDIGGRYAGTAAGFVNMVGNAGNALGPWIGAIITEELGWNFLFGVYAAVFLGAAAMWLFINPNRTFYTEEASSEAAKLT